jgi:serralysin
MTAVYLNFDGKVMAHSAAPKYWLATTQMGQTLTGPNGPVQFSDQFGGSPTFIGGGGDDTANVASSTTTIIEPAKGQINTVYTWANFVVPTNVQNIYVEQAELTAVANNAGDLLVADATDVTLVSGAGKDVMVDSGAGGDFFSFGPGSGHDVIYGFQTSGVNHDYIQLTGSTFTTFAQIKSHLTQSGSDTLLTLSSTDAVLIRNTTVASLTAADFALPFNLNGAVTSFDEEFNSLSLYNPTTGTGTWKTNYITGWQGGGPMGWSSRNLSQGEQQIYVDPAYTGDSSAALGLNPFSINNGILTITAAKTPTADLHALANLPYTSGLLTTQTSFAQLYGYFEMKAELPAGQGVWPAFWLLPTDGTWPPEVDVMEQLGGSTIYETSHFTDANGAPAYNAFASNLPTATSGYHTYGLLWTKTTLTWYVDGVEVASAPTPADMNKPMYMLVNLGIGGWPGDAPANFTTAQYNIDYIRAYSLASVNASAPTGHAMTFTTAAGHALSVAAASGVLTSDVDHNGQTLTAVLATNGGPSHGVLSLNADGSFIYTPNAGFAGTDSFTYTPQDSLSAGAATTISITVAAAAPTAKVDSYAAQAGHASAVTAASGVLVNDVDKNGLALTAALATGGAPLHGTVTLNADGSFLYTPTAGYAGSDRFTYVARDSLSSSVSTTVTVTVAAAAATAKADAYAATSGHALSVTAASGVLANDVDNNGLTLKATLAAGGSPSHGSLKLAADGSFTYTPVAGYVGTDSFKYVASDSLSTGVATTVTLTVGGAVGASGSSTVIGSASAYTVTSGSDKAIGAADSVLSAFSYSLVGLTAHNLTLTGSANLTMTANGLGDHLTGNAGADLIIAGAGNDTLTGGDGTDTFRFAPLTGHDVITDFSGHDVVDLSAYYAAGLTPSLHMVGSDTMISFSNGDTIELLGVPSSQLLTTGLGYTH